MKEFSTIVAAIYMEALYQEGLEESGLTDGQAYREAFLAMFTEDLILGFLNGIDQQISSGVISQEEANILKGELRKAMEVAMGENSLDEMPFSQVEKVLKDDTEGIDLPPSSLFSSEDYLN